MTLLVALLALAADALVASGAAPSAAPQVSATSAPSAPAAPAAPAAPSAPAAPPSLPPNAPSADTIFANLRAALLARTYPSEISYDVEVETWDGKNWHGRAYESFAFPAKSEIRAHTVSRQETADPAHPSGSVISILGFAVGGPGATLDSLGVPRLSPAYAFGLVPAPRAPRARPSALPSGAPAEIGEASAIARIYTVTLVGAPTVLGIPCWHLRLAPVGNPGTYRVRDVYVSQAGSQLVRLSTEGNFTGTETGSGRWTVDYAKADDGSWYIQSETSAGSVTVDDTELAQVRVRFAGVKPDRREFYDVTVPNETLKVLHEP